jgi:hypothetical protein
MLISALLNVVGVVLANPFFKELGPARWSIGNELWSIEIGKTYGTNLVYERKDLIGVAKGFYAGYGEYIPHRSLTETSLICLQMGRTISNTRQLASMK